MGELNLRKQRIQSKLDSNLPLVDLSIYIEELKQQRKNNPKFPKIYSLLPLTISPITRTTTSILTQLKSDQYLYTGIISNTSDLNYIVDDISTTNKQTSKYYEFVSVKSYNQSKFPKWKYLYLPLTTDITLALDEEGLLPYYYEWDVRGAIPTINKIVPNKLNIVEQSSNSWDSKIEILGEDLSHPFIHFMYFTGYCTQYANGTIVYEYFDSKGYYGPLDQTYCSNYKPTQLNYPLGNPPTESLELDECLNQLIGEYPSHGEYIDKPLFGEFIGYKTNSIYDKYDTYYLYRGLNENLFLSSARPHERAKSYADSLTFTGLETKIALNLSSQTNQNIEIRQTSASNIIQLFDRILPT